MSETFETSRTAKALVVLKAAKQLRAQLIEEGKHIQAAAITDLIHLPMDSLATLAECLDKAEAERKEG